MSSARYHLILRFAAETLRTSATLSTDEWRLPPRRSDWGSPMAKIIEFYVPATFQRKPNNWVPPEHRGKVIPFGAREKKSA